MEAGPPETRASSSPSHPLDPGGFAPGHILANRYRIVALVGRGGMGQVYRADDLKLGQPVALGLLLVARLIGRRTDMAWVVFTLVFLIWYCVVVRAFLPNAVSSWPAVVEAAVCGLLFVWVLWKHGALATAIAWWVYFLADWAPWTLEMSRLYAWRQWFVVAAIVALAVWEFRNVLGKQTAFPAAALEG
jgi:hypothetical protein